jgi:predicted transcriptional regulator
MKQLTKAEEEIMQVLWDIESGNIHNIMSKLGSKPAYNTVSTIVRILEKKGFVSHKSIKKPYDYYPMISKESYSEKLMKKLKKNYFRNSWKEMVHFFNKKDDISLKDLEEMKSIIEDQIERLKNK